MKMERPWTGFVRLVSLVVVAATFWLTPDALRAQDPEKELTFDELTIGSTVYKNVTVTTKKKDYVFLLHSTGMTTLKVAELSNEEKEKLGYIVPKPKAVVAQEITREALNRPEVKAVEHELARALELPAVQQFRNDIQGDRTMLASVAGILVLLYIFQCYCIMLICRKAGQPGGVLVWIPILQALPLLKAAGMSRWWFLAGLVPVLNIVAAILWCFKIVEARGKSVAFAIMLLLPITNIVSFLYLALSNGVGDKKKPSNGRIQLISLKPA